MKIPARPLLFAVILLLMVLNYFWHAVLLERGALHAALWIVPLALLLPLIRQPHSIPAIWAALGMLIYLIYGIAEAMGTGVRWPGLVQAALATAFVLAVALISKRHRAPRRSDP